MPINRQLIALYTLMYHEIVRMFRIASQVFLPPVITTVLYFLIFGKIIGARIGVIQGVNYGLFIAPGLIMMSVITNSYANVSTSLFSLRFQRSIEELLISPMHYSLILLGYTLGGILRGLIVGLLVFFVSIFFLEIHIQHFFLTLFIIILVAAVFSLAGFTNGMLARTFDDVAIIPTFILGPLSYLGGVFYSTTMLSSFWEKLSAINPILYMVNALRESMIGHQEINMLLAVGIISAMLLFLIVLNLILLKKGVGIRE